MRAAACTHVYLGLAFAPHTSTHQHLPARDLTQPPLHPHRLPQVLRYFGWFGEPVPDSPMEAWRVRKVCLLVYLEDDTMQVTEPPEPNSGLQQVGGRVGWWQEPCALARGGGHVGEGWMVDRWAEGQCRQRTVWALRRGSPPATFPRGGGGMPSDNKHVRSLHLKYWAVLLFMPVRVLDLLCNTTAGHAGAAAQATQGGRRCAEQC